MAQGLVGHHRPEIGPADADVDDVADGFACVPFPLTGSDGVREARHAIQDLMHFGHHVHTVDDQ